MSARVENAAPQPEGGGVAHETWAGRATAGRESTLDGVHPIVPVLLNQTRPAAVIIAPLELLSGLSPVIFVTSALLDANRQTKAVLIRNEREARPYFDDARDFRARFSKIHKRYRLAMGFTDIRVSYDKNAHQCDGVPVHKVDCNVLMSRAESRSRNKISSAARRHYI